MSVYERNQHRELVLSSLLITRSISVSTTGIKSCRTPDIANLFSRIRSLYFINLAEGLRWRVEPSLVTEVMIEQSLGHKSPVA